MDCGKTKPDTEFYVKDRKTGRRATRCKRCQINLQREKTLGITNEEYWDLYHEQDGKCGICRRRIYSKRYKRFAVDHDHDTGRIRGLLCHQCNKGIGLLRDDPEALMRAAEWVKV